MLENYQSNNEGWNNERWKGVKMKRLCGRCVMQGIGWLAMAWERGAIVPSRKARKRWLLW
jgi:hypothetical protein